MAAIGFILLSLLIIWLRKWMTKASAIEWSTTWGCGYTSPTPQLQYTANSFVRSFRKLVRPFLRMNKREGELKGVFPNPIHSETHPYDKLEALLIDLPLRRIKSFIGWFKFLQNGNVQFYILYGMIYIFIIIILPLLADAFVNVVNLIKQI
jgi:hypothetical protein